MKSKFIALIFFLWILAACTPDAIVPTPEIESRPTSIATAVAQPTEPPTLEPSPTAVPATSTPETAEPEPPAFTPRFDRFLPFSAAEGGTNSLTGLVRQGDGWQLERIPYPPGPVDEELGHALAIDSIGSDYAVATDRLLARTFAGGAGPDNLAAGKLFIVDLATETIEIIVPENVVSASWAPNGLDFAYILATDETYELRWRTANGADRRLAGGVPHTLEVSPDGRFVAFTRETGYDLDGNAPGLYVVNIETGLERQISSLDRAGYGSVGAYWRPHWTPDGSQVFLFATADDDRATTPHEAGYVWAAADGNFNHFLPVSGFTAYFDDEPLSSPEVRRCVGAPALFTPNQMVLPVGECPAFGPANPETAKTAVFTLDPQTGTVTLANVLPIPDTAQLLTWDVPGESVLLLDEGVVTSQSVTAVATTSPIQTNNRCLDANAVAQPLPPAELASLLYSEAGNLKLWQEGPETAVSLTTSGDVKAGQRSPDDTLVAFVRTVPQETAELWVVSAAGQNERRLATVSLADYLAQAESYVVDATLSFTWLPQSHQVAYWLTPTLDALGDLPQDAVTVVDADSGTAVPLFGGGEVAAWRFSPDGRLAAAFIQDGVRLIDTATGQVLYDLALPGSGSPDQSFNFAPDGRFLAAFAAGGVAIIDTSSGSINQIPLEYVTIGVGHGSIWPSIQWSPDGRSFQSLISNTDQIWGNADTTFTVWQVDVAGQTAVPLHTFTGDPISARMTANGRYLAYWKLATSQSNARELYLADLQSGETVLYDRGQSVEFINWHPNGVQFVYWFFGEKRPLLGSLCGEPVEIPGPGTDIYQLYWQTDDQFIWYTGQPDNPDDFYNSPGDWTLFRGNLNGEIIQLWQYRGRFPSY